VDLKPGSETWLLNVALKLASLRGSETWLLILALYVALKRGSEMWFLNVAHKRGS
jgi:hypothetical protein